MPPSASWPRRPGGPASSQSLVPPTAAQRRRHGCHVHPLASYRLTRAKIPLQNNHPRRRQALSQPGRRPDPLIIREGMREIDADARIARLLIERPMPSTARTLNHCSTTTSRKRPDPAGRHRTRTRSTPDRMPAGQGLFVLVVAGVGFEVAVGTALAGGPPHRSQRAGLPHWAPTSGAWRRSAPPGMGAGCGSGVATGWRCGPSWPR